MKHISLIALAIGLSLPLLLIATPHRSEPQPSPLPPETYQNIPPIEPLKPIEILEPSIISPAEIPPMKYALRPELTKAAFDLVVLQRARGATSTPENWLLALEWCESNGDNTAINEIDRDGTSSYYAYQFKPSTFRNYAEAYGIIDKGLSHQGLMEALKDFEKTRATVRGMMQDPSVIWENQFPDCVRKHIGRPPQVPLAQ